MQWSKDTKGITRSRISKKDSQYNGQKKKEQRDKQWMIYKTLDRILKIKQHEPPLGWGGRLRRGQKSLRQALGVDWKVEGCKFSKLSIKIIINKNRKKKNNILFGFKLYTYITNFSSFLRSHVNNSGIYFNDCPKKWRTSTKRRYIYIYVWKLNQTVLELDIWAVKFLFFPRWDLDSHHWYTATPIA